MEDSVLPMFAVGSLALSWHRDGRSTAARGADALIVSSATTLLLKELTHETRPRGEDQKSFPSFSSSAAFSVASFQAYYHPKEAWAWYAGASVIAASRLVAVKHYPHDVAVGAAIGYFAAKASIRSPRGLVLAPLFSQGATGVSASWRF